MLKIVEAARLLNVSYWTVAKYVRTHRIQAYKVGQKWRIPMNALTEFVERNEKNDEMKET